MDGWMDGKTSPVGRAGCGLGAAGACWCLGTEVPWPWGSLPVLWLQGIESFTALDSEKPCLFFHVCGSYITNSSLGNGLQIQKIKEKQF